MVRAKIQVLSVTALSDTQSRMSAMPVCGTTGENADYSKYTPSGSIELTIDATTKAATFFAVGKEYYVDFSPAT